ncbi:MAG: glutathionylspermidine synthase family protein [Bacteroidota bacterium]
MVDSRLLEFKPIARKVWKREGLQYFAADEMEYLTNELLGVRAGEVRQYFQAAQTLQGLFEQAAQHIIDNQLWEAVGIPKNAVRLIEYSWNHRQKHPMLYGRFDLSGVIDGKPPKLIEYNADTATVLAESALIQAHQLQAAKLPAHQQANTVVADLATQFDRLRLLHPQRDPLLLLSTLGHVEDYLNADVVAKAAEQASFDIQHLQLSQVVFSPDEGIFIELGPDEFVKADYWFKLIPWEFIATEEPELMDILTNIVMGGHAVILNPAYTLLYQSKAILKILWDLFPNHPNLLPASYTERAFKGQAYVEKVIFGREGENIRMYDHYGQIREENGGDFAHFSPIYQAYEELPQDSDGDYYQAGVYMTYQPSCLSYRRRDGLIVDTDSEFIGHYLMD